MPSFAAALKAERPEEVADMRRNVDGEVVATAGRDGAGVRPAVIAGAVNVNGASAGGGVGQDLALVDD